MKDARRKEMAAYIARKGSATMEELRDVFHVSMNTVRSDVAALVQTRAVEKVYGGVRAATAGREIPLFTQRTGLHPREKLAIARQAQALIQDRDILYVDTGTTTMHLIDCLDEDKHVTIVTGNLRVIAGAYEKPNVELIVLPGSMDRRTNSVSDVSTLEFLGRCRYAKAFMGVSGVSEDGKLNVSTYIEYELKKLALRQSQRSYLLVDGSKFGGSGLMTYGSLAEMTGVVTDPSCPGYIRTFCRDHGVAVTIAQPAAGD